MMRADIKGQEANDFNMVVNELVELAKQNDSAIQEAA